MTDDHTRQHWNEVDRYITEALGASDPVLEEALEASARAGLPAINVSPPQGKFLHLLARSLRATTVLEIGTLGGYSAIWLARALPPGGRVVTLELDPDHARVARATFDRAGLADVVDLRVGPALDTLPQLAAEGAGPFDVVFIDADKQSNAEYFTWALRMTHRGSVIVVDNVVRNGNVVDPATTDPAVAGVRRLNERMGSEPRVSATAIQTVGVKGYDGFALAVVVSDPEGATGPRPGRSCPAPSGAARGIGP